MAFDLVISGDSHVTEPFDLWEKALGKKYGDAVPRALPAYLGRKGNFFFSGIEYLEASEIVEGSGDQQQKMIRAGTDPVVRLTCLKEDGIYAEIINATWCLYVMRATNDDLVRDCCRVFNDWIADYCSEAPKILLGTAMIHMQDVDWAVKELERAAKRQLRSVIINADARPHWPPYRDQVYDKFWAAACELKMPVTLHIITGEEIDLFALHGKDRENMVRSTLGVLGEAGPVLGNEFIYGGILDRFPDLRVVLSEYEVSWLPYYVYRMRQIQDALGPAMRMPGPKRRIDDYLARQIYHGMVDDPYLDKALDVIDARTVLWGSDFPHVRCAFPNTQQLLQRIFGHLSPDVQANVVWRNAARLYNIELPTGYSLN